MEQKKVLVTGIGGNVGQGIIRNIKASDYDIKVIGTNISAFSPGNHLCDAFYEVPYAYDENYIPTIQKIIAKEGVDLIIPSTDYESYYLSVNRAQLNCPVATSAASTTTIYLDKYETFLHHEKHGIAFAKATLPSLYKGEYKECILKPKKGRGSRGLHLNPKSWEQFSDEEYMVQDLIRGKEITCAFYVNKQNRLHGMITFERELENGATNQCTVIDDYDTELKKIILQMIEKANFAGAANLQAIVNEETGEISPFEINCRISGTNSIRSNFGFKDIEYTLQEYVYDEMPEYVNTTKGSAVRILMDVIYRDATDVTQLKDNSSDFYLF